MAKKTMFQAAGDAMGNSDNIGARTLKIAFHNPVWTALVAKKIKAANNTQPSFRIIRRPASTDEVWLVSEFAPRIPPLTFRALFNLKTETVGPYEDPFIQVD